MGIHSRVTMKSEVIFCNFAFLVSMLLLSNCTFQTSETPTVPARAPLSTPIVALPEGEVLPPQAALVSIEDLLTQPEEYEGKYVEVHGINAGTREELDCLTYEKPPFQWILLAELPIYENFVQVNNTARIDIKNTFNNMINSPSDPETGYAIRNTMMKQVVVWGWVRLYEGPVGCVLLDMHGEPLPEYIEKVWYIDGAQLQFLESVEP